MIKRPLTLLAMSLALAISSRAAVVENLRCEGLDNPLGIEQTNPRLSWRM